MKKYFRNVMPQEFFTSPAYIRAFVLGLVYLTLAILQLFTFEKFIPIVTVFGVPGGAVSGVVVAALIPLLEVAALPYLISMNVAPKTRQVSRIACIALPIVWLIISVWVNVVDGVYIESGLMGATLSTSSGIWMIAFSLILLWAAVLVVGELPKRHVK